MRTVGEQARVNVLVRYSAAIKVHRDGEMHAKTLGEAMEHSDAIVHLRRAFLLEQTNPTPEPPCECYLCQRAIR